MDPYAERRLTEIEDGLVRELQAFLGGNIFSGYSDRTKLRADDLAVRARASAEILDGKAQVSRTIGEWSSRHLTPSTSENPLPPPALTSKLQALRAFERSLGDLENAIRSAAAPDFDNVWQPTRDGASVLQQLLSFDLGLIEDAAAIKAALLAIQPEELSADAPFAAVQTAASRLRRRLGDRESYLRHGTPATGAS